MANPLEITATNSRRTFRVSGFGFRVLNPTLDTRHSKLLLSGQASLEMTAALIGVLLLFAGSLRVFLWVADRLISRQQYYEQTRVAAGSAQPGLWNDPASKKPLRVLGE